MYGWTVRECLDMPARQFFTMLKTGRELEHQKRSNFFADLCDIAFIPKADVQYGEKLRQFYSNSAYPDKQTTNVMNSADISTGSRIAAAFKMGIR